VSLTQWVWIMYNICKCHDLNLRHLTCPYLKCVTFNHSIIIFWSLFFFWREFCDVYCQSKLVYNFFLEKCNMHLACPMYITLTCEISTWYWENWQHDSLTKKNSSSFSKVVHLKGNSTLIKKKCMIADSINIFIASAKNLSHKIQKSNILINLLNW